MKPSEIYQPKSKFINDPNFMKGPKRGIPKHLAGQKILEALHMFEVSQKTASEEMGLANSNFVTYLKGRLIPGKKMSQKFKDYFEKNFGGMIIDYNDWRTPPVESTQSGEEDYGDSDR